MQKGDFGGTRGTEGVDPGKFYSSSMAQSAMGVTGSPQNSANLKGKLAALEELIKNLDEELNMHKTAVGQLRSDKEMIESILTLKTQEVKKTLTNELFRVEEEMKKHFSHQKAENARLQQQITQLKSEKTVLQQQLVGLKRKIEELEQQVGKDEQ
eukprot:TRINITY_DN1875_c0_g1_i6.p1 TRINITY_DN1875_c0_g1~~TRINITY_DN1875_c0_g1_i6.p1  ORF type:complete len:155 (+),score=70.43 TRINITY_DN1875_c0_g1_i6:154-618(+)